MSSTSRTPPRRPRIRSLLLAACVCCAYGHAALAQRAGGIGGLTYREAPAVNVRRQGIVSGVEVPVGKFRAWTYLGIPYARPPLGDFRFAPPVVDPLPAWDGVRNGSAHMPACIQSTPSVMQPVFRLFTTIAAPLTGQFRMSEDCLYLNVYRPEGTVPDDKFPVMVWIHPGDFHWGSPMVWDASYLVAKHKVIVVTMAYRLNILGFFTDNTAHAPGNWGLMDQAAALDWVRRNIDSFGGSAQNVTVFGQGSGAVSVGLHLVSPGSRDKFQRAISMSGNALHPSTVDPGGETMEAVLNRMVDKYTCFRQTVKGCLRNVDAETLVREAGSVYRWGPMVDGLLLVNETESHEPFLPDEPSVLMDDGRFAAVAHMIGYNRMEGAFEAFADGDEDGITRDRFESMVRDGVMDDDRERRRRRRSMSQQPVAPTMASTAEEVASLSNGEGGGGDGDGNCTFDADFVVDTVVLRYARQTDDPETLRRNFVTMMANKAYGAPAYRLAAYVSRHNATFVYRYDYKFRTAKAMPAAAEWMDAPHGAELPMVWGMPYWPSAATVDWISADKRMADSIMTLWTNFAKNSDPLYRTPLVRWEEFQSRNPRMMVIDKQPNMSLPQQEPEFWNEYYPKALAVSLHCCPNHVMVESAATSVVLVLIGSGPATLLLTLLVSFVASPSSLT